MWGSETAFNYTMDVFFPLVAVPMLMAWAPIAFLFTTVRQALASAWPQSRWPPGLVVVITGATSGIGEHLAYECARRGCCLLLSGQRGGRLQAVAQRCQQMGAGEVEVEEADVRDERECRRVVERAVQAYRKIDMVVCNAGIMHMFQIKDVQRTEAIEEVMDTNFYGSMWLALYSLPYLRHTNGRLLVTSSVDVFVPLPYNSVYKATKSAVTQLFDTMRAEPIGADVSITVALPGATATEMIAGKTMDERGRMEVDADRRDATLGPQPMLHPATVASAMLAGAWRRQHYVLIPAWFYAVLLLRLFAPELLDLTLRYFNLPVVPGVPTVSKLTMEAISGREVLYRPPATSQEEAEEAVKGVPVVQETPPAAEKKEEPKQAKGQKAVKGR